MTKDDPSEFINAQASFPGIARSASIDQSAELTTLGFWHDMIPRPLAALQTDAAIKQGIFSYLLYAQMICSFVLHSPDWHPQK